MAISVVSPYLGTRTDNPRRNKYFIAELEGFTDEKLRMVPWHSITETVIYSKDPAMETGLTDCGSMSANEPYGTAHYCETNLLDASTTYYYRAVVHIDGDNPIYGEIKSFTTPDIPEEEQDNLASDF